MTSKAGHYSMNPTRTSRKDTISDYLAVSFWLCIGLLDGLLLLGGVLLFMDVLKI